MAFNNLREFIQFLESKDELIRIKTEVDSDLEVSEITDRTIKNGGPALLFENVKNFDIPILTNMFGTHQRTAWALGVEDSSQLTSRVREILGIVQTPPTSIFEKLKTLKNLIGVAKTQPKIVKKAPCQEMIYTGNDINLESLPHLKCWPMDGGKYITLPLVISRDPNTNKRNVGI